MPTAGCPGLLPWWCLFVPNLRRISSEGLGSWLLCAQQGRQPRWGWAKVKTKACCALGVNPNLGFPEAETASARPAFFP